MPTSIEKVIKKAVEGGWTADDFICDTYFPNGFCDVRINGYLNKMIELQRTRKDGFCGRWVTCGNLHGTLLDPLFWQALGKAMGWGKSDEWFENRKYDYWQEMWHRFIDHLASGGEPEEFFTNLLNEK